MNVRRNYHKQNTDSLGRIDNDSVFDWSPLFSPDRSLGADDAPPLHDPVGEVEGGPPTALLLPTAFTH